jgi:transmembrane sensor
MVRDTEEFTSISEQAAHWWVVFRDGGSPAQRLEFAQWIMRAPERVEAYLRVARVHAALSRTDLRWPKTPAAKLIQDALTSVQDPTPLPVRRIRPEKERPRLFSAPIGLGVALSLLLAIGVGWHVLSGPEQFQTQLGEQLTVRLGEGSRVTLNTDSKIAVRLQADRRIVDLLQGEALFEVAHDATRPFDVHVGKTLLRDLGTRFDVDRRPTRTVVTVVEGRVGIIATGSPGPSDRKFPELSEADRAIIGNDGSIKLQHGVSAAEATAWTRRSVVFRRRPMHEVAAEFNRYNREHIEIRSPALQAQEITGTFRSDDPKSFLAYIADIPGVHIAKDGRGGYVVTLEEPSAPRP